MGFMPTTCLSPNSDGYYLLRSTLPIIAAGCVYKSMVSMKPTLARWISEASCIFFKVAATDVHHGA
jgi:hypothetical protein